MDENRSSEDQETNKVQNEDMKNLISTMNKVQDILALCQQEFIFQLPQIAVVGAQSAGKSSVLESIVGREFLPRGKNIVTRRPIIIQFITDPVEKAVFLHRPEKFTNFLDVQKEIENETERLIGKSKSVSSAPINLKIFSPNVLNLTLVDLPGLTKVPVHGQPTNIDEIIWKMVKSFIESDNSLILAVTQATQDLATSDALKMAREVDPNGERTIGVITHLDTMSPGTNACAILENTVFPLKKGYVGVINRNQDDINCKRDIHYSLLKEKKFFEETICYRDMADRMGIKYLQKRLNNELKYHIKQQLPHLRTELCNKERQLRKELGSYKTVNCNDAGSCLKHIIIFVNDFIKDLNSSLIGSYDGVSLGTICCGAHINKALYDDVQGKLNIDLTVADETILKAIVNSNAIRTGFLLPQAAFDSLCRDVILRYKTPISNAANIISQLTQEAVEKSSQTMGQYPCLRNEVVFKVKSKIAANEEKTKEYLLNHIEAELSFINVRHPDFSAVVENFSAQISTPKDNRHTKSSKDKIVGTSFNCEEIHVAKLGDLVSSYMNIVDKTIKDMTLKYIVCFIVRQTVDYVSSNLIAELTTAPNVAKFFEEYSEEVKIKEVIKNKIAIIQKALKIILEI